jgi:hypothetical protein
VREKNVMIFQYFYFCNNFIVSAFCNLNTTFCYLAVFCSFYHWHGYSLFQYIFFHPLIFLHLDVPLTPGANHFN